ncbi:sensor histidine kinase [Blastococcus sp. VKM Ac-2987]|uniref:sensor histidine kinase n=1 Tax=Blastococcus sp. VKM Ac-2987 TaxID=3004141 RepID=UPI0022AB7B5C|nr:histidine kinase [Blastococcus sp. VKM Ac-2987]MCZ2858384.1 histidine kinase [Blastococcus sp. VKM Ac-2987]
MPRWPVPSASLVWPVVGVVFGGMSLVEIAIDTVFDYGPVAALPGVAVGLLLVLLPRWPASAALAGSLTVLGNYAVGTPGPGGAQLIGMGILVGHAAAVLPARRGAVVAAAATLIVFVSGFAYTPSPWEGFFYLLVTGAAWGVGTLVRQMRARSRELQVLAARLAEQQEAVADAAVVAERSRIAREVHDSVAHSVSVMVLQMGGLRRLLPHEPAAQEVLLGLERLGREAVDEMRRVVGILREGAGGEVAADPAPQPSLSRLDAVLDELRAGGLAIDLRVTGEPVELPQLVDVSAVRVVQEALSNVLRHAGGAATTVDVGYAPGRVTVTVTDDGRRRLPVVDRSGETAPGGHGQLHMRERVAVAGGSLEVGPVRGGGYRVRAAFPVPVARPATVVTA